MREIEVYIEKCRDDIELPTYAKHGDAGMDVRAAIDITLNPSSTKVIPTGIKVAIPEGYEIQVRPRSGLSLNTPLRISNSPGTIDSGYKDEIGIIITNISDFELFRFNKETDDDRVFDISTKGNKQGVYHIKKGDRIAQLVLSEVPIIRWVETESVVDIGFNRQGGFGSSGTT